MPVKALASPFGVAMGQVLPKHAPSLSFIERDQPSQGLRLDGQNPSFGIGRFGDRVGSLIGSMPADDVIRSYEPVYLPSRP